MFKATPQTLDRDQLQALAALARLELSEAEIPALQDSINQILLMVADLPPTESELSYMPDETLTWTELQALAINETAAASVAIQPSYLAEIAPAWSESALVVPEVIDQTVAHQKTTGTAA